MLTENVDKRLFVCLCNYSFSGTRNVFTGTKSSCAALIPVLIERQQILATVQAMQPTSDTANRNVKRSQPHIVHEQTTNLLCQFLPLLGFTLLLVSRFAPGVAGLFCWPFWFSFGALRGGFLEFAVRTKKPLAIWAAIRPINETVHLQKVAMNLFL